MPYNLDVKGWMEEHELEAIERWAALIPSKGKMVEVGSFYGRSSCCWAASVKPNVAVYCIDKWGGEPSYPHDIPPDVCAAKGFPKPGEYVNTKATFLSNVKRFDNVTAIQASTPAEIAWTRGDIDLFFLDASHGNPSDWDYIEYWLPRIKSGGHIAGHDYELGRFNDVVANVWRLETMLGVKAEMVAGSTLWLIRKP